MREASLTLPLLPLSEGAVLLPGGFLRVRSNVGNNVALAEHLLRSSAPSRAEHAADVAVVPVASDDDTSPSLNLNQLNGIGTAARVVELVRSPSTNDWVIVLEGRYRVSLLGVAPNANRHGVHMVTVRQLDYFSEPSTPSPNSSTAEEEELRRIMLKGVKALFAALVSAGKPSSGSSRSSAREMISRVFRVLESHGPAMASDLVGGMVARVRGDRLKVLSTVDVVQRLRIVNGLLEKHLNVLRKDDMGDPDLSSSSDSMTTRRRREPLSAERASKNQTNTRGMFEADSDDDDDDDVSPKNEPQALFAKIKGASPPADVLEAASRECKRLRRMNEQHPGYAASISYLETLAGLPWSRRIGDTNRPTLEEVRAVLDADHHGLDKVKDRIIQYVAVQSLRGWDARAPVLCLVGPPGVGKTTVARSLARALRRPFQRISLGGVRDEAEIRGHRRTYIGAFPGRIVTALRRAGVSDAVLLIDEIDKTGRDARGDPAAALLEVLDPEQNAAFVDTYLGVPVDLSKVVFVATANSAADIPPALLDRLEIVNLGGYTLEEKMAIAAKHLIPRALLDHGIGPEGLTLPPSVVASIIEGYTREAGVRQLSRCIDALCRYVAVSTVREKEQRKDSKNVTAPPLLDPSSSSGSSLVVASEDPSDHTFKATNHVGSTMPNWMAAASYTGPNPAYNYHQEVHDMLESAGHAHGVHAPQNGWRAWLPWHGAVRDTRSREAQTVTINKVEEPQGGSIAVSGTNWGSPPFYVLGPGSMGVLRGGNQGLDESVTPDDDPVQHSIISAESPLQAVTPPVVVDEALIEGVLGPRRYKGHDEAQRVSSPGAAAGLVWTAVGGQVMYIECLRVGVKEPRAGPGSLTLTGQLGDVLEESARVALSWVRAHADWLGMPLGDSCPARRWDVHVHLPAGAVPKDGPSAGVTLAVALTSLFTDRAARADTALTGELTLRGLVLPVGGIKEKVLAAVAAGFRRVILPSANMRDVQAEVPAHVVATIEFIPVDRLDQALTAAFDPPLPPTTEMAVESAIAKL